MNLHERIPVSMLLVIGAALIALQAVVLVFMGHPLICTCGTVKLWHGIVSSSENSQQLADWYTYTHVIHGFGFYLLLWLIAPRLPFGLKLSLAIGLGTLTVTRSTSGAR